MTYRGASPSVLPAWAQLFLGVLRRRPARAIAIAYWFATRRRVRARNWLRDAAVELLPLYPTWIRLIEDAETRVLRDAVRLPPSFPRPRFSLLVHAPAWSGAVALDRTLGSIDAQICRDWDLIITGAIPPELEAGGRSFEQIATDAPDGVNALRAALAAARGDFVMIVPPDAVLPPGALLRYQQAALVAADVAIFYGDEDAIDPDGHRSKPWFKPQWDAELVLALDYVSRACVFALPVARAVGEISADLADCVGYAFLLAAAAQPGVTARHIAHVLCHLPKRRDHDDPAARLRAVARYVERQGGRALPGPFGTVRVRWPLPDPPPPVTIIVPTRDRADLLESCIGSLLRETRYPNYDILIVDNGSTEPATHAWFAAIMADPRVSVLRYDHPYNYSAINNFAAARAHGAYLCLLNNDTEIIDGAWLDELMRYATRPGVGGVGAKLLYEDGSIQHAGVVVGLGDAAGHAHRALPDDQPGYFALAHCAHYASAVTAACLVVERAKYEAVGGLDEINLQIAYNDVDLCLKLDRQGWRNVYAPQAIMIHYESKSRGQDLSSQHVERYRRELAVLQERWDTAVIIDPMHHPRLDRSSETYRIHL
ncbi:glycosyltransferase family 2 protein [Sphingomonas sp. MMS24-J13]|uniref:glycosyltransferase family 2 protein n=1 Tax=Sphingomonas sp. MMS24-J13 TaxID=3238686 RepID=UPI00384B50BF